MDSSTTAEAPTDRDGYSDFGFSERNRFANFTPLQFAMSRSEIDKHDNSAEGTARSVSRSEIGEFDPNGGQGRMRDVESLTLLEDVGIESE